MTHDDRISLAKRVYDLGAEMRKLNAAAQNGDFDYLGTEPVLTRDAVRKMNEANSQLSAWLFRYVHD